MDAYCPCVVRYAPSLLPVLGIHNSAYRQRQERLPGEFQTDSRRYTGSRDTM